MADILIDRNLKGFDNDFFQMQEALVKLQKTLYWLLGQLDSLNVRRLSTNRTDIKSDDGNTVLDGTQIIMKDKDGVTRAKLGLNKESNKFEFTLFNKGGAKTITLDDNGDAEFEGDIKASNISGSAITGSTVTATSITGGTVTGANIVGGSITSNTNIDVTETATVGEILQLRDGNVIGGYFEVNVSSVAPTFKMFSTGSRPITISAGGGKISLHGGSTNMYVMVDGVKQYVQFE